MLRIAFLPDVANNFLTLWIAPGSESDSEGSECSDSEDLESSDSEGSEHKMVCFTCLIFSCIAYKLQIVPLSHEMVGRLLHKLFNQKVRQCGNVSLRDRLQADFPNRKPLDVVTAAYAVSLVSIITRKKAMLIFRPARWCHHQHVSKRTPSFACWRIFAMSHSCERCQHLQI